MTLSNTLALAVTVGLLAIAASTLSDASSVNPEQAFSARSQNMKIKITIAGKTLTATLADNETAPTETIATNATNARALTVHWRVPHFHMPLFECRTFSARPLLG
jgi:hypothetical protein